MKFTVLCLVLHCCLMTTAQEYVVANSRQRPIYLGIDNPIDVFVEGYSCASLYVSTDNGVVKKYSCTYVYHPSRTGDAVFTIFKIKDGKRVKLKTRKLYVLPFPKPIAQVGSFENGSIVTKASFCIQQGVAAFPIGGLGFELTFKVIRFSVIIAHDSTILVNSPQTGNKFDEKLHTAFLTMEPGSIVLIANIWVVGPEGKPMKLDPLEYMIQ